MSAASHNLFPCPQCGAAIQDRSLNLGEELRCGQCGKTLKRLHQGDLSHHLWALSSAGLILWILANAYPILTFNVAGNTQSNLIITGVHGLVGQGFWPVAFLVFFCSIAAPLLHLGALWYVAGACCLGKRWPLVTKAAHLAKEIAPWSLVPVFMIACFVAVVKLDMLGTVYWDTGILWVSLLAICSLAIAQLSDHQWIANRLEELK